VHSSQGHSERRGSKDQERRDLAAGFGEDRQQSCNKYTMIKKMAYSLINQSSLTIGKLSHTVLHSNSKIQHTASESGFAQRGKRTLDGK
jgi:hypothetical protein